MRTLALCLLFLTGTAAGDCSKPDAICAAESPWGVATTASVRAQPTETTDSYSWELAFAANGDVRVDVDNHENERTTQGEILFLADRAMLTRGLPLLAGNETEPLGTAITSYQIVAGLLDVALPEGPAGVESTREVDVDEAVRSVHYGFEWHTASQSSRLSGWIPPPWKLRGVVEKIGERVFEYSLTLAYTDGGEPLTARFSGVWDGATSRTTFDDAMSVAGWALYTHGPSPVRQERGALYADVGQGSREIRFLGELREALERAKAATGAGR